ncbi:MAG: DUF1622 domain-containing protein [Betaproteobacteria bacterium]|jgi:uncharacterized membrane protein
MEALLQDLARYVALVIQAIAIVIVAFGTGRAVVGIARLAFERQVSDVAARVVWLRYAHALVAGLTFQLAADVVATTVAPSWEEVGRLAAVAGIRTFLSYFLDHEVASTERLQALVEARGPREAPHALSRFARDIDAA